MLASVDRIQKQQRALVEEPSLEMSQERETERSQGRFSPTMNIFSKKYSTGVPGSSVENEADLSTTEKPALIEGIKLYQSALLDIRRRLAYALQEHKSDASGVVKQAQIVVSDIENMFALDKEQNHRSRPNSVTGSPHTDPTRGQRSKRTSESSRPIRPFETYSRTTAFLSPQQSSNQHESVRRSNKRRVASPVREKNEIRLEQLKETARANRYDVRKFKNEFFTDCDVQYH